MAVWHTKSIVQIAENFDWLNIQNHIFEAYTDIDKLQTWTGIWFEKFVYSWIFQTETIILLFRACKMLFPTIVSFHLEHMLIYMTESPKKCLLKWEISSSSQKWFMNLNQYARIGTPTG